MAGGLVTAGVILLLAAVLVWRTVMFYRRAEFRGLRHFFLAYPGSGMLGAVLLAGRAALRAGGRGDLYCGGDFSDSSVDGGTAGFGNGAADGGISDGDGGSTDGGGCGGGGD